MKKLFLVLWFIFTINVSFAADKTLPKPNPTTTRLKLPTFSSVHIRGFINVMIQGKKAQGTSDTVIESYNPQWVNAKVSHHTLYLRVLHAALPSRIAPTVTLHLHRLKQLEVYGRASVIGRNIKSDGLYLRSNTTRNITLQGNLVLKHVINKGLGHIKLRWVRGRSARVQGLAGSIQLAGSVDQLRVKLRHHAVLDAQYLRANHIFIQTKQFSSAKVLPVQSLRAFATDFSNIYYYKEPKVISRYTDHSGNVLQAGRRN